ncbi:hypothetical protein Hanom_Chr00s145108g01820111 [Helianthus anomalus]
MLSLLCVAAERDHHHRRKDSGLSRTTITVKSSVPILSLPSRFLSLRFRCRVSPP